MKFLCDRCKTRYSIGDDRVRGKILKIRCKNCANVITVREGMNAEDLPEPNRGRATTAAPEIAASAPAGGALASAFAQQATKPPPALEEEWYVSIDGDQSGPFSLTEAQKWIAGKAFDADVHCWSEGFDDWLPVDKVSHFRGLRKKPAPPTAPPPLPRAAPGRSAPAAMAVQQEEEPKPLFAATMASLEKGVPTSPLTPPNGILAKANGRGSAPVPAIPAATPVPKNGSARAASPALPKKPLEFDASEPAGTAVDEPAFEEPKRALDHTVPIDFNSDGTPEDDSLDIGEVSRVVNLADLAKSATRSGANRSAAANPASRTTTSVPKLGNTGTVPRLSAASLRTTGTTPKFDGAALGLGDAPAVVEQPAVAAPVVHQAHRRGMIMLIGVAAVLLIGVAVLMFVVFNNNDSDITGGLGPAHTIDTSRPEELVLRQLPGEGSGIGSAGVKPPVIRRPPPVIPHPNGQGSNVEDTGEGKGDKLKSDEIEDMARKQSAGTQRCYMRAQRGAEGIEIQDLKKLSVTLTIDKTGNVSDVALSDHQNGTLGTCLVGAIKHWKFRESPGGLYRIVLAFAS